MISMMMILIVIVFAIVIIAGIIIMIMMLSRWLSASKLAYWPRMNFHLARKKSEREKLLSFYTESWQRQRQRQQCYAMGRPSSNDPMARCDAMRCRTKWVQCSRWLLLWLASRLIRHEHDNSFVAVEFSGKISSWRHSDWWISGNLTLDFSTKLDHFPR